ncbi:MAG: pseudouridine synthase [Alphaproteobacteria bacterium]|nr:pseudouridine synthase [Alphaproteobacteria bacterium]
MAWSKRYDGPEPQRINKWLAQQGVCSRRDAEDLIARGLILINGETVSDLGRKIAPGETLTLRDAGEDVLKSAMTVIVHKPVGYVSAQPEKGQIPAARLLTKDNLFAAQADIPARDHALAPLGRLDQDSRGLLLLSDDGVLAKTVIGPESALEKDYRVRVDAPPSDAQIAQLRHGLSLDGRVLKPAIVTRLGRNALRFILREGRNRQIRRMCALVGLDVLDLFRTRIGPLDLGDLPEGRWRPLTPEERAALLTPSAPPRNSPRPARKSSRNRRG